MHWRLDRELLPLIAAVTSFGFWGIASIVGAHPDGAILGFSGTMFMLWATVESEGRRSRQRQPPQAQLPPPPPQAHLPPPHRHGWPTTNWREDDEHR